MPANATAHLTADVVALAGPADELQVLLIERRWPPYERYWALPGGHLDEGEDFEEAARRELAEETGVQADHLTRTGMYSDPERDPRGRYVTVAYLAIFPDTPETAAGDDARTARWMPVLDVLAGSVPLAFDHHQILDDAIARIP